MPKELYVNLHFTLLGEHAAQSCSFDDSEMRRCREEKTGALSVIAGEKTPP